MGITHFYPESRASKDAGEAPDALESGSGRAFSPSDLSASDTGRAFVG
jgi:hypothetical protein